jgi:hypothetical protein
MTESNILRAIINIERWVSNDLQKIHVINKSRVSADNRVNVVGDKLDYFIRDAFCDTFNVLNDQVKYEKHSKIFSYLGNQNNPPDIMLRGGDSIEVKKKDGIMQGTLQLNSSPPRSKLFSDDLKITKACKDCEQWNEKDLIYAIGNVDHNKLKILTFVYGDCYAASKEIYERVPSLVRSAINKSGLNIAKTKELGRINKIDPLSITNMRIRGMWTIEHPLKLYGELIPPINEESLIVYLILRTSKYKTFPLSDRKRIESSKNITVEYIKIRDPDNPAKLINSQIVTLRLK